MYPPKAMGEKISGGAAYVNFYLNYIFIINYKEKTKS